MIYNMVGNQDTVKSLKKSVERDELVHAYIIEGTKGMGKKTLAMEFAAMILCSANTDRPCGRCNSCIKVKSGNHPDLYLKKPAGKEYQIGEIALIQKEMRIKPNESNKKVIIITEGERISDKAQNQFLKTLEEPPGNAVVMILTQNINILLKTTVSRCRHIKLQPVGLDEMKGYLNQNYSQIEDLEFILAFSDGSLGRAIELLEDQSFTNRRNQTVQMLNQLIMEDQTKVFSAMEFLETQKENILEILDMMIIWFRDILFYKKTANSKHIINCDKTNIIKLQAERLSEAAIYEIVAELNQTKQNLNQNVNFQLSIEIMLLKIQQLGEI